MHREASIRVSKWFQRDTAGLGPYHDNATILRRLPGRNTRGAMQLIASANAISREGRAVRGGAVETM